MKTSLKNLLEGAILPFRAMAEFFIHPRYWLYALLPVILCTALYLLGAFAFFYYALPWVESSVPATWTAHFWGEVLLWLLRLTAVILVLTLFLFTFTTAFTIIAAPFIDLLAEVFERRKYHFDFRCNGWRDYFHYNVMSMVNSARVGFKILLWAVVLFPINLLLPGPGIFLTAPIIGYYFGITMLVYASEHRRIRYADFISDLRGSRMAILGMGTVFFLLLMIPFAAIICLPVAVIAGTMLYNEKVLPRKKTDLTEKSGF